MALFAAEKGDVHHITTELAFQFEAVSHMPEEEKKIIRALLDGMILKYQAKQITERG
ncbi:transcriptional regulator [Xenorhabdus eapokensis]|uniref:Transcriptional regulator n=1 Tax=Xenorhabdus eapokensis TaxID=1873482 RepID=A0A1Q5TD49_9GAMM|nr:hypothetical protein [Xenorhabdus eapokensis]OKO98148.1 transcriptional regulator [Xenorhabdus eapokensis]